MLNAKYTGKARYQWRSYVQLNTNKTNVKAIESITE